MKHITVRFTITADVLAEVEALRRGRRLPCFWYTCIAVLSALNAIYIASDFVRWHAAHGFDTYDVVLVTVGVFGAGGIMTLGIWQALRVRRIPMNGELEIADSGIGGTLDGHHVNLPWAKIACVERTGSALVITQRDMNGFVIPIMSVPDFAALWTYLEERLVSRRGLVRSSRPSNRIVNTASSRS